MRWTARLLGGIVALLLIVAAAPFVVLNTDAGRRFAERLAPRLTGGEVVIAGLAGRFPEALRLGRLELRDSRGAWLTVRDAALDWRPAELLAREVHVTRLAAAGVTVARRPPESPIAAKGKNESGTPFELPIPVVVDSVVIDRLVVEKPVAGTAATLAAAGSARLDSLESGTARLALHAPDGAGYTLDARFGSIISAALAVDEPARGLLAGLAKLPDLGAIRLRASADGPLSALKANLDLHAGALGATVRGQVDVPGRTADLDMTAHAPAMTPAPDVAWQSVNVDAHVHGPWLAPHAQGTVDIERLSASGAALQKLTAKLSGDLGRVALTATAEGVRIPGPAPDLLGTDPVVLRAEARLDDPRRPVSFALTHPLLSLQGTAQAAGEMTAKAHLDVPSLAPLAALGAPPLAGHAGFDLTAALPPEGPALTVEGTLALTDGPKPLPALFSTAHLAFSGALHGETVAISHLALDAPALTFAAHGSVGTALDLAWQAGLPDVSAVAPQAHGALKAEGTVHGSPQAPSATVDASGTLQGAPLTLAVAGDRSGDGAMHLDIRRAEWASLHAEGALGLVPAGMLPSGHVTLRMDRLADLAPLVGQKVAGAVTADVTVQGEEARVQANVNNASLAGTGSVARAVADVRVRDPLGARQVAGSLDVTGLAASGVSGSARMTAQGTPAALGVTLTSVLPGVGGAALNANAAARVNATASTVTVSALSAQWQDQTLRLLAPATLTYAEGMRVDRVRLGLGEAVLEVAGRVSPALGLTVSLRDLPASLVHLAMPDMQPSGMLNAQATLGGTTARPTGRVHLALTGLRVPTGPTASLPAASLIADATLAGTSAQVTAHAEAGTTHLSVTGTAPLAASGALALHAAANADLKTLDPLLAGAGRRVLGHVTMDASINGSVAAPRVNGSLRLADGDFQDATQGIHLSRMTALVNADGDTLHLAQFSAAAGHGTITGSGSVGLAGELPVDVTITGRRAQPIASNLVTADLDTDLTLRGGLAQRVTIGGTVTINRADINVPEQLPAKVVVLDVRRPGQKPPAPAAAGPVIGLGFTVSAPNGRIFVRGRGLDVELEGHIALAGTTVAPRPTGRFTLRRGTFSLVGQTLTFTSGDIGFDGSGKLDPTLNLVATGSTTTVVATLTVSGYASAPKFTLSSVPDLPQDQILATLLFNQNASSLSAFQLAEAAAALAQLTGVGSGFDPLSKVRQGLGLDRLSVGSSPTGSGAALEAGRYVAPNIYVGARQSTGGGGSQAVVQVDIFRGLKLQATAGTGSSTSVTGATATTDPTGSSVGVTYQFEY